MRPAGPFVPFSESNSPRQGGGFACGVTRIAKKSPPYDMGPHDDIPPKAHGLIADSKTVAPRMDGFLQRTTAPPWPLPRWRLVGQRESS